MASEHPLQHAVTHTAPMLVVDDLEASVQFYREKFGFDIQERTPSLVLLSSKTMLLYLITESPPTDDKPNMLLTNTNRNDATAVILVFIVPDCRAVYNALLQLGVEFLAPPHAPPWGGWRCFVRDPSGYLIEIVQEE